MKRVSLIIITFCLLAIICGCKSEKKEVFLNEPEGFRNYNWGTKYDDIDGLEIRGSRAKEFKLPKYYAIKKNEDLEYEGINVSEIVYGFEDHLLTTVRIDIPSKDSFEKIKETLFNKYGTGEKFEGRRSDEKSSTKRIKKNDLLFWGYLWEGEVTWMLLDQGGHMPGPNYGILFISVQLSHQFDIINPSHVDYDDFDNIDKDWGPINTVKYYISHYKWSFCGSALLETSYIEGVPAFIKLEGDFELYYVYLCKLFEQADNQTDSVYEYIENTKQEKSDYYYFSIFLDRKLNYKIYSEQLLGPFKTLEDCQKLSNYALEHNIPIRQCRSWESYLDYQNRRYKHMLEEKEE